MDQSNGINVIENRIAISWLLTATSTPHPELRLIHPSWKIFAKQKRFSTAPSFAPLRQDGVLVEIRVHYCVTKNLFFLKKIKTQTAKTLVANGDWISWCFFQRQGTAYLREHRASCA
jgi:hypothetical protein